jgi:tRNA threonylcarbamoyl adenosine modification protein (Sua5/YciO/YrdC/YwlC family)
LTLVCRQQPSLKWDLGETRGTVAVRMPDDEGALGLLGRTGPMAVSSANVTGQPAATDADEAERMLGQSVEVVLDGGPSAGAAASTIVDCTGDRARILREGAIGEAELRTVLEGLGAELEPPAEPTPGSGPTGA